MKVGDKVKYIGNNFTSLKNKVCTVTFISNHIYPNQCRIIILNNEEATWEKFVIPASTLDSLNLTSKEKKLLKELNNEI